MRYRVADKKALDQFEERLPRHVTEEVDRVIGALTTEIRVVADSVVAVHDDLRALMRGEVKLDSDTTPAERMAAT